MPEIYKLTQVERYAALAVLHRKWGNDELAEEYEKAVIELNGK